MMMHITIKTELKDYETKIIQNKVGQWFIYTQFKFHWRVDFKVVATAY